MQRIDHPAISEKEFGGKAAKLSQLLLENFPVKNGIGISVHEIKNIRETGQTPEIPELNSNIFAVRSSAVGEDSNDLSWAGQFKTILFVQRANLNQAILECVKAQDSETVIAYAKTHGVEIPSLALLVQEIVDAEIAGVLFTVNPVTGLNEIVIEAISGVGVGLVDGSICPQMRYYIDPNNGRLLKGEGEWPEILPMEKIGQLVDLAKRIQALFGCPQDIEWAIERGTGNIFINQTRDITTLNDRNVDAIRGGVISEIKVGHEKEMQRLRTCGFEIQADNFLSDQNITELLTPHPCRMSFGLFTYEFAHGNGAIRTARNELGYDIGPELETGFFWLTGGQPRCSIIHDALTYRIKGIPLSDYARIVHYYLERISEDYRLANYPEIVLYNQNPPLDFLVELFGEEKAKCFHEAYKSFFSNILVTEREIRDICLKEFLIQWKLKIGQYRQQGTDHDLAGLVERFQEICELLRTNACPMFVKVARLGFFAYARLRQLLIDLFGTDGEKHLNILTSGISPDVNPNLSFNIKLAGLGNGSVSIDEVVAEFGHLAPHELEISCPRYRERPEFLQELSVKIDRDPSRDFNEAARRSAELTRELMKTAGQSQEVLAREIETTRIYLPLREVVKFYFLQAYDLLRETVLVINKILGWDDDLIFHLDPLEVFNLVGHEKEMHSIAARRYKIFRENKALYVPTIINVGNLEEIGCLKADGAKTLQGIGVTSFVAEGNVVVIENLNNKDALSELHKGAIIVTVTTDPAWTPLLSIVGSEGGIITEIGGLLAHGAIYAREVGMAAVLNVPNATHILKTGMRVRVNGPAGYVEILDH